MYILMISRGYPTEKYKMNGIFEFDQAKALVQMGHKVVYVAIDLRSIRNKRKWGHESLIKDGVQIEAVNIPCGRIPTVFRDNLRVQILKKIYKKIKIKYGEPDIIHSHFITSSYSTARVINILELQCPLVVTEHFSGMNQEKIKPYYMKLGNYTYPSADKLIAVSNHLARNIKSKFNIDASVIPNIVDISNFSYKPKNEKKDVFTFVSTGNLLPNKRMDLLIKAFYKAFKAETKVKLYIFGDGPERSRLDKMVDFYNLKNKVILEGLVDRKEIATRMNKSHCFVLASRLETFGVAYIEALAMGLPVIATISGGPEDFVHEENGKLVPADDVNALSKMMLSVYNNIDSYDKIKIAKETNKKFSPESIANELYTLYKQIIMTKDNGERKYVD